MDLNTGLPTAWNPGANGPVNAMANVGILLYVGGSFTSIGGQARSNLAVIDAQRNGDAICLPVDTDGPVRSLAVGGTTVYAAGSFTRAQNSEREKLAAFRNSGLWYCSLDPIWQPPAPDQDVLALAAGAVTLFAGGTFETVGGEVRKRLAGFDLVTGDLVSGVDLDIDGPVRALAIADNQLYLGGTFTSIDGIARNYLAAVPMSTGALNDRWNPDLTAQFPPAILPSGEVNAISVDDSNVYAAGSYAFGDGLSAGAASFVAPIDKATAEVGTLVKGSEVAGNSQSAFAVAKGGDAVLVGGLGLFPDADDTIIRSAFAQLGSYLEEVRESGSEDLPADSGGDGEDEDLSGGGSEGLWRDGIVIEVIERDDDEDTAAPISEGGGGTGTAKTYVIRGNMVVPSSQ